MMKKEGISSTHTREKEDKKSYKTHKKIHTEREKMMGSKRVLFTFNYYKCYSCDNIIDRVVGLYLSAITKKREETKSHCFIVSNVTHHELNNLTGENNFKRKKLQPGQKEMILVMRLKKIKIKNMFFCYFFVVVVFGTRSRFLPIGLNTLTV